MRRTAQNVKISPKYTAAKLQGAADTLENRVDVYEDRMRGWLIDWADHLNGDDKEHAGFAVLSLAVAYFEAAAIFARGENSDGKSQNAFFRESLCAAFPEVADDPHGERIVELAYREVRCGLFHKGMTGVHVLLCNGEHAFRYVPDSDLLLVCRYNLVSGISAHLARYVDRLRDPAETEVRERFQLAWRIVHSPHDR